MGIGDWGINIWTFVNNFFLIIFEIGEWNQKIQFSSFFQWGEKIIWGNPEFFFWELGSNPYQSRTWYQSNPTRNQVNLRELFSRRMELPVPFSIFFPNREKTTARKSGVFFFLITRVWALSKPHLVSEGLGGEPGQLEETK